MSDLKSAAKLALEALERSVATCFDQFSHEQVMSKSDHFVNQTIKALEEALKQEHGEPVAIVAANHALHWIGSGPIAPIIEKHRIKIGDKLYTTPQQRKPLTDEQIEEIARITCIGISPHQDTINFARVIEAAHGIIQNYPEKDKT